MRTFFYDDDEYEVAETADELISLLKEGDEIMSNHNFEGDTSYYVCGDVPTYIYSEVAGEPIVHEEGYLPIRADTKGFTRNEADVRKAVATLNKNLELDIFREDEDAEGRYTSKRFFYNANGADLSWHFEV